MGSRTAITLASGALALSAAAAILTPAGAGAAGTPTVSVSGPSGCFVNTYTYAKGKYTEHYAAIKVTGAGWTPGDSIQLSMPGAAVQTVTAKANGTISASFQAPDAPAPIMESTPAFGSATITATDEGSAAGAAATGQTANSRKVLFTDREVQLWESKNTNLSGGSEYAFYDHTDFKAFGFTPGRKIYAYYVNSAGKLKGGGTVIGTAKGPCGVVHTGRKPVILIPKSLQTYGYWTLWFSTSRTYSTASRQYAYPFLMDSPDD